MDWKKIADIIGAIGTMLTCVAGAATGAQKLDNALKGADTAKKVVETVTNAKVK
ncbi:MAG: hypothetical protein IJF18_01400 [Oscillospiraceae bacterium]|nr:hypothetical protein [Oscillospiraceae bacterium]